MKPSFRIFVAYVLDVTAMIDIQAGNGSSASVEGGSMKTALMSLMMTNYVHSVKFSSSLYNLFCSNSFLYSLNLKFCA